MILIGQGKEASISISVCNLIDMFSSLATIPLCLHPIYLTLTMSFALTAATAATEIAGETVSRTILGLAQMISDSAKVNYCYNTFFKSETANRISMAIKN